MKSAQRAKQMFRSGHEVVEEIKDMFSIGPVELHKMADLLDPLPVALHFQTFVQLIDDVWNVVVEAVVNVVLNVVDLSQTLVVTGLNCYRQQHLVSRQLQGCLLVWEQNLWSYKRILGSIAMQYCKIAISQYSAPLLVILLLLWNSVKERFIGH